LVGDIFLCKQNGRKKDEEEEKEFFHFGQKYVEERVIKDEG
jgi:hypothetical protein